MISVIIPVYNVELYIKQCLDSVINQTYTDLQIIIIDDGSTDGSKAICEEYANRDSRMVFISQENAGVSSARNKGIEQATGEWISFVDADDWLELNAYEKILDYSNKYDTPDLIFFNRKIMKNGMLVDYSDFE